MSEIEPHYSQGKEKDRLQEHPLERDRTLSLLKRYMPPAPAVVFDVGGAAGAYAFFLAEQGYEVHLIDPIPLHIHIEQAKERQTRSSAKLKRCIVGDARKIDAEDATADAILFFGPLYHLIEAEERLQALKEAHRVLKKGGTLFAVMISRFASFMDYVYKLKIGEMAALVKKDLVTGIHKKEDPQNFVGYFHRPKEFKNELVKSGFSHIRLLAIEGPIWQKSLMASLHRDPKGWEALLTLLESIEEEESLIGSSGHIMSVSKT